jgi:hypothetical protein
LGDLTTLYEANPRAPGRDVLKRAVTAANDVYGLLERDIIRVFADTAAAQDAPAKAYGT